HAARGGGGLLDQRRVLLRGLVHLGDGLVDLLDARALLLRGGRDVGDDVGDPLHAGDDLAHRAAGLVDQLVALADLVGGIGDGLLDLLGGAGRALGQRAHFGGDHGESAPLLAGAGGLDRGAEGGAVGLEGDAIDDADDVGDAVGGLGDGGHGLDHAPDDLAALGGDVDRADGQLVGLAGVVGVLAHGGGEFLHGRGGFLERGGLLLGAARQVVVAGGDLAGGRVDRVAALADVAHDLRQLSDGAVGRRGDLAEAARHVVVDPPRQVAPGDRRQQPADPGQALVGGGHQPVEALDHL